MTLVDASLLLYAEDSSSLRHEGARRWWDEQLSGSEPVCLCWSVLSAFLRITTNPRILAAPLTRKEGAGKKYGMREDAV